MSDAKLRESRELLRECIAALNLKPKDRLLSAATSKSFEVAFEYAWKALKRSADKAGMEVYSPRDAIKAAAQLNLIQDIKLWDSFLNARNLSVHDYVGISDRDFLPLVIDFEKALGALLDLGL